MTGDFWMDALNSQDQLINIQKNWRCKIENISVTCAPSVNVTLGAQSCVSLDSYKNMKLSGIQIINNSLERAIQLNEKIEQFISLTKLSYLTPVVRTLGIFSGFGSCWERSNKSDLKTLELDERSLMMELVKTGCDVRVLINLDMLKALAHGFTREHIKKRVADMCSVCDELKDYKNLQIAIDNFPSVDPIFALDKVIMVKNYNFDGVYNGFYRGCYNYSAWTSSLSEIELFAARFDFIFLNAIGTNRMLMSQFKINSYSQLIYWFAKQRFSQIT